VSGDELASRALQQAKRLGAEIVVTRRVESIDPAELTVTLDGGDVLRTRSIVLAMGVEWRRLEVDSVDRFVGFFVLIGAEAATDWLPSEIARDEHGFVLTGTDAMKTGQWKADREPFALETSVPRIFAVGDIRSGSVKRVAASVGEGGMAVAFVHRYLQLSH
jgi:thioredoxin reductase (NADPH)